MVSVAVTSISLLILAALALSCGSSRGRSSANSQRWLCGSSVTS